MSVGDQYGRVELPQGSTFYVTMQVQKTSDIMRLLNEMLAFGAPPSGLPSYMWRYAWDGSRWVDRFAAWPNAYGAQWNALVWGKLEPPMFAIPTWAEGIHSTTWWLVSMPVETRWLYDATKRRWVAGPHLPAAEAALADQRYRGKAGRAGEYKLSTIPTATRYA